MRRPVLWTVAALAALLIVVVLAGESYVRGLAPRARQRVVRDLANRFDADVQLDSLTLTLMPLPSASGQGLTIRHRGWASDQHPLISIRHFTASSNVVDLFWQRDRVSQVVLEGLEIHIPPRGGARSLGQPSPPPSDQTRLHVSIGEIIANDTLLEIEPKKAGKDPLQFQIQQLNLQSVSSQSPVKFVAKLVNAKPPGLIDSTGTFGPWQKDEPRATPVGGNYTFANADLSVFKGISGTLSSNGSYNGVLEHIEVSGTTDTPNFSLKRGGAPVHLKTNFHSIVNGTDGETLLDPVDASFLNSRFICQGGVIKQDGQPAKTVDLYASTRGARIEDILTLVIGDPKPLLTGAVDFRTKIVLPPGDAEVLDKLTLNGRFQIQSAHFTSPNVARRLDTLSNRANGISKHEEEGRSREQVASNFSGVFRLENGRADFSRLSFDVPGAAVGLTGNYRLRSGAIDMKGLFRMRATLSDTQSGWKHWVLKPVDPIFRKDGAGFELPFNVTGTRDKPEVSAEIFHHRFSLK